MPGTATSGLADSINTAIKSAPELAHSPGLAVGIATSGGDTAQRAQAVARGANEVALGQAHQNVEKAAPGGVMGALSWLGKDPNPFDPVSASWMAIGETWRELKNIPSDIANPMTSVKATLGSAAAVANKPLTVVQHEYRYLSDVEATHGLLAAIAATVPLAAGAVAGGIAAGPQGAILGAETATAAEGQVMFHDSWQRTQSNQYVDPRTGKTVDIGTDVANLVGASGTWHGIIQHTVNGISQIALDPVAVTGSMASAARGATGAAGKLGDLFGGTAPVNAEDVDRVYSQYASVRNAFAHIATLNAGQISSQYRDLSGIARELGAATTSEEVGQVFKEVIRVNELITTSRLPTMAATRVPFNYLGQLAQSAPDKALGFLPSAGDGKISSAVDKVGSLLNPQAWSKRLSSLPRAPIIEDGAIKDYGMNVLDPSTNHGLAAFRSFLRYAETGPVADAVTTHLANTVDVGERITIVRNAVMDTVMHMAGFSSEADVRALGPDAFRAFKKELDNLTGGGEPGVTGVYGSDGTQNISQVLVGDRKMAAGLLENQTGLLTLPDLRQMRMMAKYLAGNRMLFSSGSDFMYKWATQAFFKRFVLLTPSYGLHISLAEMIPNAFRLGFMNLAKSGIEANLGRLSERAASDEGLHGIAGGVWRLAGGTRGLLPEKMDAALENKIKFYARIYHAQDGHLTTPGISAGENISKEVAPIDRQTDAMRKAIFNTPVKERSTGSFGLFHQSDPRAADSWQDWLGEISKSEMSRKGAQEYLNAIREGATHEVATRRAADVVSAHLDSLPAKEVSRFVRHFHYSIQDPPPGLSTHDDWANQVVKNLQGATTGQDGMVHVPLLDHIIKGETAPSHELDAINEGSRPAMIKGRQMVPDPENTMQKIANWGFHHVLNPMVNFLSREPIYATEAWNEYSHQLPAVADGRLSDDQAFVLAQSRATNTVIKNVHNLNDRTQWTVTMRNFAPFFFAQEQAYRRAGRLLASNPGAFRRYQMSIMAVSQFTSNQQRNGQFFTVIPGTGLLTSGVVGVLGHLFPGAVEGMSPMGMGWSTSSANVIFPLADGFRPGVGPAYAVPIKAVTQLFPDFGHPAFKADLTQAASDVVGNVTISEDLWKQLVPNVFVQRVLEATRADDRSFSSSMMQQMIALDYLQTQAMDRWVKAGHLPTDPGHPQIVPDPSQPPSVQQDFINRLRNGTRINYIVRALLGFVTPVSPEIAVDNWGLPAQLSADIKKAGNVSTGIQEFLAKNPSAQAFTTFQSHFVDVSGSIPASVQAETWVNDHYGLIQKYPAAAAFLMPQETNPAYSPTIYNEQLAQGLRTKFDALAVGNNSDPYNPSSFLDQLYVNAANHTYYDVMLPSHEAQLANPNVDHTADNAMWSSWVKSFEIQNPVWASWHGSTDRTIKRQESIQQLREIFKTGQAPPDQMSSDVQQLLGQYEQYQNAYVNRTSTGASATDLKTGWQAQMQAVKKAVPTLAPIINSVFLEATPYVVPLVNGAPS
jgi:hypothetical protein